MTKEKRRNPACMVVAVILAVFVIVFAYSVNHAAWPLIIVPIVLFIIGAIPTRTGNKEKPTKEKSRGEEKEEKNEEKREEKREQEKEAEKEQEKTDDEVEYYKSLDPSPDEADLELFGEDVLEEFDPSEEALDYMKKVCEEKEQKER